MTVAEKLQTNLSLVLIADDMTLNQRLLEKMVVNMGLVAEFASDGFEAVEKYLALKPSLILMDVNMPGMGGIEAARQIKHLAADNFIPIIFVSGAEGQDIIRNAIDAGGDDFIQRPFPFELLEGKIVALRRISELYQQVAELNQIRQSEVEVAEQLFSGAIESSNVGLETIRMHKQPATTFSGDVQLTAYRPNGDLNILLGDFTGHGLTSTLGALPLAETFRAMTAKGYAAEEVIAQINAKLYRLLPTGLFLAVAVVTLEVDGTARIWNGGLPDVMVFSQGELVQRVSSSHPPLGILPQVNELSFEISNIQPEDHILMISDGVIEAENAEGDMFGEARMFAAITDPQYRHKYSLVDSILTSLQHFVRDFPQRDDISLIDIPGNSVQSERSFTATSQLVSDSEDSNDLDVWDWGLELQGRSLARIDPVAQALSRLQESEGEGEHWHTVFSILTELYVNALDHGVLKLESSLKDSPEGFARYFSEREKRLETLSWGSVSVHVQHARLAAGGRVFIRIEDSGDGFDYEAWLSNENAFNIGMLSGRGIELVSGLCESVEYSNHGATVEVVYVYSRH
ncbi:fused response regulator/phosphatase [Aliamphritea hakodatensis]|uniref:fused response regulator/phosphatase n=1 Tax=Aliamphritea hakodatensis TaxID=2895352 RepID=UPI0022FD4622|nr:fused response regulator/phosphatase [Aliamphritea hakodatensis]